MPEFLTTNKIIYNLENIILTAKKEITLVSPYLRLSQNIFNRLSEVDENGIIINFVYGKADITKDQSLLIGKLNNANLYFSQKLHAKCYFNEERAILTSLNLYEFSERDNLEMGILVSSFDDSVLFSEMVKEVRTIVKNSKVMKEISKDSYLISKTLSEQFYNFYVQNYPNDNLGFEPMPGRIDTVLLQVKINQEPFFRIWIDIDHRIEAWVNSYSKSMVTKLFKEFKTEIFSDTYRIYWDSPKNNITIYNSVKMKGIWDSVTIEEKIKYYSEALHLLIEELNRAYSKID